MLDGGEEQQPLYTKEISIYFPSREQVHQP